VNYYDPTDWPANLVLYLKDEDIDSYYNSPPVGTCLNFAFTVTASDTYAIDLQVGNLSAGQVGVGYNFSADETYGQISSLIKLSNTYPKWTITTLAYN